MLRQVSNLSVEVSTSILSKRQSEFQLKSPESDDASALFWQGLVACVLGVAIGLVLLQFTNKPVHFAKIPTFVANNNGQNLNDDNNFWNMWTPLNHRMFVLLMGVDSNGRNTDRFNGTRSDTMMLVCIDPQANKVGVVSLPRDSRVELAGGRGIAKLNAAHALGGPQLTIDTIASNFYLPVDRYIVVDTHGLKKLFELIGPVEVMVEKDMHYRDRTAGLNVDLKCGLQTLTPEQMEEYVRFRHDEKGDIGRIERQQWFMRQVAKRLQEPQTILKIPDFIQLGTQYVHTDLSFEDMARLASYLKDFKRENVKTAMLPGEPSMINGGSYWLPDMESSFKVFDRVLGYNPVSQGAVGLTASETETLALYDSTRPGAAHASTLTQNGSDVAARPMSVAIKYPRGCEAYVDQLEKEIKANGWVVRYKWLQNSAECSHEQIVQNDSDCDENKLEALRTVIPQLSHCPVVVSVVHKPATQCTIVVSPSMAGLLSDSSMTGAPQAIVQSTMSQ